MPTVPPSRRAATAAVNALRTLLEDHDHIVEEIDQRNDFGEDLYVTFTEKRRVTGDVILDGAEVMWLAACFSASAWARAAPRFAR